MKCVHIPIFTFLSLIIICQLIGCSKGEKASQVDVLTLEPAQQTNFLEWPIEMLESIPDHNPSAINPFQIDLRYADISKLDLSDKVNSLLNSSFSTATIWPDTLPSGFDPDFIMENGKDPGLGLRELHSQGYTGKGVSIAIIDQELGTAHPEYSSRLAYYESFTDIPHASMHGCAVASLAVGQNIGVAPEANLYFIAPSLVDDDGVLTFHGIAKAIDRIVEINNLLPESERIRSISIARGIRGEESINGYSEVMDSINRAEQQGIFVITTSMDSIGFQFMGLERDPLSDPNDLDGYSYPYWWNEISLDMMKTNIKDNIGFPMGSRTYAGSTGSDVYEFGKFGGYSRVVPYINGLYAIAVQVYTDITPREFWDTLSETAQISTIEYKGEKLNMAIADPTAFIESIETKRK